MVRRHDAQRYQAPFNDDLRPQSVSSRRVDRKSDTGRPKLTSSRLAAPLCLLGVPSGDHNLGGRGPERGEFVSDELYRLTSRRLARSLQPAMALIQAIMLMFSAIENIDRSVLFGRVVLLGF